MSTEPASRIMVQGHVYVPKKARARELQQAHADREKAEAAARSLNRELAAVRKRCGELEAKLKSLGAT